MLRYFVAASPDQTHHTKQLEYDYPWLDEDKVEPFISNYDMFGEVYVIM